MPPPPAPEITTSTSITKPSSSSFKPPPPPHPNSKPQLRTPHFDPYNSSSTGHQRAENRLAGSPSWRDSRTHKLAAQFSDKSGSGGDRLYDLVGAGSVNFGQDGRLENGGWERGAVGLRRGKRGEEVYRDVGEMMGQGVEAVGGERAGEDGLGMETAGGPGEVKGVGEEGDVEGRAEEGRGENKRRKTENEEREARLEMEEMADRNYEAIMAKAKAERAGEMAMKSKQDEGGKPDVKVEQEGVAAGAGSEDSERKTNEDDTAAEPTAQKAPAKQTPYSLITEKPPPQIFANCTIYINGSTYPTISDHKLKHLLAQHGARVSLALGRRSVTHVIVGKPNDSRHGGGSRDGAGGGLSASKIQKEIALVRGCGVKFVGVEWVLECVRVGKRVGEAGFAVVSTAPRGVGSVRRMFEKVKAKKGRGGG